MPTIVIPAPQSVSVLPGAYYRWPSKIPQVTDSYTVDFTAWATAVSGDTLATCAAIIAPAGIAGGLAAGAVAVSNNGAVALLSQGLAGQDYAMTWIGTTTGGRLLSVLTMLYCPPAVSPAQTALTPPGYGTLPGSIIMTSLVGGFPTSPLGMTVGGWWSNDGIPQQVPPDWPTSASGLLPGTYWLNSGIVFQA